MSQFIPKTKSWRSKKNRSSDDSNSNLNKPPPPSPPQPSAPPASPPPGVGRVDTASPSRNFSNSITSDIRSDYFDKPLPTPPPQKKTYTTYIPNDDGGDEDEEDYDEDSFSDEEYDEYEDDEENEEEEDDDDEELLQEMNNNDADTATHEAMYGDLELSSKQENNSFYDSFVFVDTSRRSQDHLSSRRSTPQDLPSLSSGVDSPGGSKVDRFRRDEPFSLNADNTSPANRPDRKQSFRRRPSRVKHASMEKELRQWIEDSIYDTSFQYKDRENDLLNYIQDGVVLCKLANSIVPNLIQEHEIQRPVPKGSSSPVSNRIQQDASKQRVNKKKSHHSRSDSFRDIEVDQSNKIRAQMNIQHFREACVTIGLPAEYILCFEDLYVEPNKKQVLQNLMELKRHASIVKAQNFRENLDRGSVMDSPGWTVFEAFALPLVLFYVLVISNLLRLARGAVSSSSSSTENTSSKKQQ